MVVHEGKGRGTLKDREINTRVTTGQAVPIDRVSNTNRTFRYSLVSHGSTAVQHILRIHQMLSYFMKVLKIY